jgi:hypothetical protein
VNEAVTIIALLLGGGAGAILIVGIYIAHNPEKVEQIVGWVTTGIARLYRKADKTAVAMKVQGEVNGLRARLHEAAPAMLDRKLKIRWTTAEEAEAAVRGGDVIVFMRDSRRPGENVATAVMAYLPKALIPRSRRYVEPDTMKAIDLTIAKAMLTIEDSHEGALDVFYERHLDPARAASTRLKEKIAAVDAVDLHGWLSRILLAEYRRLGDVLHPADPDDACLAEAERFADWLAKLANRGKHELGSLTFRGTYISVAIILVARREVLAEQGIDPYRKRAKRHLYADKFDSVYLLARDPNIGAVDELVESFGDDAMVASSTRHLFRLRRDFHARTKLRRERSICVCLRRRGGLEPVEEISDEDVSQLPLDEYEVGAIAKTEEKADTEAVEEATADS